MNEIVAASKGFRGRGLGYSRMKAQWTQIVWTLALAAKMPRYERVALTFHWYEKDRRRDPDNFTAARKFVLDGLVKARVLPGDGWAAVESFTDRWSVHPTQPGVSVIVSPA